MIAVSSLLGSVGWGVILVAAVALYTFLERTFRALCTL
jgi:hypothetical protein